jgi:hypothetical protein
MIVQCFTVTCKTDNPIQIDTVYAEFGQVSFGDQQLTLEEFRSNIPKYLQYEGGSGGTTFLCCVAAGVNVSEICDKYNYECGTIYQLEMDDDKYNNAYTIYPTYMKDGPKFVLQNIQRH